MTFEQVMEKWRDHTSFELKDQITMAIGLFNFESEIEDVLLSLGVPMEDLPVYVDFYVEKVMNEIEKDVDNLFLYSIHDSTTIYPKSIFKKEGGK